jgi:hypothetical protein
MFPGSIRLKTRAAPKRSGGGSWRARDVANSQGPIAPDLSRVVPSARYFGDYQLKLTPQTAQTRGGLATDQNHSGRAEVFALPSLYSFPNA